MKATIFPDIRRRVIACRRSIIIGFCIAVISTSGVFADKTTVDPNTVEIKTVSKVEEKDARLDRKITYVTRQARLHAVIKDISEQTGVVIHCGKDTNDWQVRDFPIVVSVKEMPLGAVLESIAGAAHVMISSNKVGGIPHYRLWRDASRRKEIEDYLAARREAQTARSQWTWAAWESIGRMTDDQFAKLIEGKDAGTQDRMRKALYTGRIVNLLPPDAKDKIFAGEAVRLYVSDTSSSVNQYVSELCRLYLESNYRENPEYNIDAKLENSDVAFKFDDNEPNLGLYVETATLTTHSSSGEGFDAYSFRDILPAQPKYPTPPDVECPTGFVEPSIWSGQNGLPKIKLKKPDGKQKPDFSDVIIAMSKASGYSIICADFVSQSRYNQPYMDDYYEKEINLGQALNRASYSKLVLDENNKMLVCLDNNWCYNQSNLVPESFLNGLKEKLDGEGLEFDDAVAIFRLTEGQRYAWIYNSNLLRNHWYGDDRLWQLYDSLSPKDKALAKSEAGLPLSNLDQEYLKEMFTDIARRDQRRFSDFYSWRFMLQAYPEQYRLVDEWLNQTHPECKDYKNESVNMYQLFADVKAQFPELANLRRVPTDPDAIAGMILRVKKYGADTHQYTINITCPGDDKRVIQSFHSPQFPLYSEEREKQLKEEAQKTAERAKQDSR